MLRQALASVRGEEVVVVDDSDEGGLAADRALAGVTVVRTPGGVGFARAANAGLAAGEARGWSVVLLLNDDAAVAPGAFEALCAELGPHVGAAGPVLEDPQGRVESAGVDVRWWGRVRVRSGQPPAAPTSVSGLTGACLLLRPTERFDVAFAHGMEDLELCQRLRRRGLDLRLVPAARCRHVGGATLSRRSPAAQRHLVSGHLRLVGGGARTPVVLGLALAQVAREGGDPARLRAVWQGWQDWRGR